MRVASREARTSHQRLSKRKRKKKKNIESGFKSRGYVLGINDLDFRGFLVKTTETGHENGRYYNCRGAGEGDSYKTSGRAGMSGGWGNSIEGTG